MMTVTLWGTRGSLATPGASTARYGGNTSCVQVDGSGGTALVLDAGTGIRPLGDKLPATLRRVDVLLTHLHMDHIQGLGFFAPLYRPDMEVHIWGPASSNANLRSRLTRYLSPPLFPVHLRDLPCKLSLHEVPQEKVEIGEFLVTASLVCHPGPTVGYRIANQSSTMTYLPDHEPALGMARLNSQPEWTSGFGLAEGVDLLIHDSQYTEDEYRARIGWGHSSFEQALDFAALAGAKHLVPFHHDPAHNDEMLDHLLAQAIASAAPAFCTSAALEGAVFQVGPNGSVSSDI